MSERRSNKRPSALRKADVESKQDERRTALGTGVSALPSGGGIFKSAAVAVLRQERKLMTTGEITKCAIDTGLIKCQGKTPEATMASALYTDVKRKLDKSVFTRPQEGLFGLREWIDEGFFPEGWAEGPADGLGLAPFKRRASTGAPTKQARNMPGRVTKARAMASWREGSSEFEDDDEAASGSENVEADEGDDDMEAEGADDEEEEGADDDDEAVTTDRDGDGATTTTGGDGSGGKGTGGGRSEGSGRGEPSRAEAAEARADVKPDGRAPGPSPRVSGGSKRQQLISERSRDFDRNSPLHLLAAASKSAQQAESGGGAGIHSTLSGLRKRRMTSAASELRGEEQVLTPKSPYEDSLAALHEIATSPISYAHNGIIDLTSREQKRRPKVLVDPHDGDGGGGPGGNPTPSSLFRGLDSSLPQILSEHAMNGSGFIRAPLMLNIPSITSPSTAYLESGGLMSLQLPDTLPGTPGMLSAALHGHHAHMQGGLLTSNGLGLRGFTPRGAGPSHSLPRLGPSQREPPSGTALLDGLAAAAQLAPMRLLPVSGTRMTPVQKFSGGNGGNGGGPALQHMRPVNAGSGGHSEFGRLTASSSPAAGGTTLLGRPDVRKLTPMQVDAEVAEIGRVQAVVERLEAKLGRAHPQVGKAWLALARMYQHVGAAGPLGKDRASQALERAWAVCRNCAQSCGTGLQCEESFTYLQARVVHSGCDDGGGGGRQGMMAANPTLQPTAAGGGTPASIPIAAK